MAGLVQLRGGPRANHPVPVYSDRHPDINGFLEQFSESDPWLRDPHPSPQTALLGTELDRFDFVGRTDQTSEVFKQLSLHLGETIEPQWMNRQKAGPNLVPSERSQAKLNRLYRPDFDVLHSRFYSSS